MKVEIHGQRIFWLASLVVLFMLRDSILAMSLYMAVIFTGVAAYLFWLPRKIMDARARFKREAFAALARNDRGALMALVEKQWLLNRVGPDYVIPEVQGIAAASIGQHEAARAFFAEALRVAPQEERTRVQVNLAGEELALGHLDAAEGRYRAILRHRPDLPMAVVNLARVLRRKREALSEASALYERALTMCERSQLPELKLELAETLALAGDATWESALQDAAGAGADADEVARVQSLAVGTA
jgi:tetratricopeptide (TPR) repeat protein